MVWGMVKPKAWEVQQKQPSVSNGFVGLFPSVGSDPEFARYVAGVNQAMQQKRQAQHVRRPSTARGNWPLPDDPHKTWPFPDYFTEG